VQVVSPAQAVVASYTFTVQMKTLASFLSFQVTPSTLVTGATGVSYAFSLLTGQELASGVTVEVDLPPEVVVPDTPLCTGVSATLLSVACTHVETCLGPNKLKTARLQATLTFTTTTLAIQSTIEFSLDGAVNPPSTRPYQVRNLTVLDLDKATVISLYNRPLPFVKMSAPAEVALKSLALDVQTTNAKTAFTISFTTMNIMPVRAAIVITYPASALFPPDEPLASGLFLDGHWTPSLATLDPPRTSLILQLQPPADPTTSQYPAGTTVSISLKSVTNTALPTSTASFTLVTYTDATRRHAIDRISSGLALFSCDPGFYLNSDACIACPSTCRECLSAAQCTACYENGPLPVLYQGACLATTQCS